MTDRFEVSGYIPQEEHQRRLERVAQEVQIALTAERSRIIEDLRVKINLAKTSTAPKDCVVEVRGSKSRGLFFSTGNIVVDSYPAWYLGGYTIQAAPGPTDFLEYPQHYAITSSGRMLRNGWGVGERKEFMIGVVPNTTIKQGLVVEAPPREIGGVVRSFPDDIEQLRRLAALPGWDKLGAGE